MSISRILQEMLDANKNNSIKLSKDNFYIREDGPLKTIMLKTTIEEENERFADERRLREDNCFVQRVQREEIYTGVRLKKDGTPDKRYIKNKSNNE